jgi:CRISPR-associated protein Csy1
VTERFAARVQRAIAARGVAPGSQLKFLPRMNTTAFRRVLAAADVVIDTLRWSGGNTSLDAIASGTPVVTCPGRFMRARQTAAMLRMIGLAELVVDSADDLVARAVSIARDPERNWDLRRRIAERRALLFDQDAPVEAFGEALLRLGAGGAA